MTTTAAHYVRRVRDDTDWTGAACQGEPLTNWFFTAGRDVRPDIAQCRLVCSACPIQEKCLEYALAHDEYGVWGGTTREERRAIKRRQSRQARREARRSGCP